MACQMLDTQPAVKGPLHLASASPPHTLRESSVAQDPLQSCREGARIVWWHQQPLNAIGDELWHSAHARDHHWDGHRHGLHGGDAEGLFVAGQGEHMRSLQLLFHYRLAHGAQKLHLLAQGEVGNETLQLATVMHTAGVVLARNAQEHGKPRPF